LNIVVGIPAYNEEKNIAKIIVKIREKYSNIIICNDGSSDSTGKIAESLGVTVVNHSKNMGYGAAIRSLFLKAKEMNSDILVTFDGDGQHQVQDIDVVVESIKHDKADIVIGSRFLESTESIPAYRKAGIKLITKLTSTSLEKDITDSQSGFRAYNKKVISSIIPSESGMGASNEILIKASKSKFRIAEVPIKVSYEGETSTHNPVGHGASVILSTMKFISIEHPLKFYGIPGLIFLSIGLFFTVWTLQLFSETRQIMTNLSLIAIGTIIFGAMLMMTSIMLYSIVNLIREKS